MQRILVVMLLLALGPAAALPVLADDVRTEQVRFDPGTTSTTIKDAITGWESVSYLLGAKAGQTMEITLEPSNGATYFNLYEPGRGPGDQALANSGLTDAMVPDLNQFKGVLPASGEYTISVYMMRSAARRDERSDYTLHIAISALDSAGSGAPATTPGEMAGGDALVAGSDFNATGEIPCAREAGQPMGQCEYGVNREGDGSGMITVSWPDGGNRVIFFENGQPTSFDRSQADGDTAMDVSKDADLFKVSIGSQRFEIPQAVITGD